MRQLGVPLMGQGDQGALLQSKTCTTTLDGRADLQSERRRLAALARRRYTELAISPAMGATGTLALLRRIFSIKKPATVAVTLKYLHESMHVCMMFVMSSGVSPGQGGGRRHTKGYVVSSLSS